MKLHWSPRSPFVRKVMVTAHEHGITGRLTLVRSVAIRTEPNAVLMADNPLNKIPTLVLDDGAVLQDSRVICEYLDAVGPGRKLFPAEGWPRWDALRRQAFADGFLDLLLALRGERDREGPLFSTPHVIAYETKVAATLERLEAEAPPAPASIDIGDVTLGCTLAYLDFRFANLSWRTGRPRLTAWDAAIQARPSFLSTAIVNDEAQPLAAPAANLRKTSPP